MPVVSGVHSPRCLGFGLDIPHTPVGVPGGCPGGEEAGAAAAGEFPQSAPEGLFLFEKILLLNPVAPYKEGPVLSHSPPLQLDQDCLGQGPTLNFPWLVPVVSVCLPHFILIPLPATSSNQVSWCYSSLVWQGRK